MLLDTYKVDYKSDNKKGKKKQGVVNPNDKSIALNEESVRKARERRKQSEWTKMPFSDLSTLTTQNTN